MPERKLIRLDRRYPDVSRMSFYRWRQQPDFPVGVVIRGREYFYEDELEQFEASHRRRRPQSSITATA
jgi:hypothetical protein